MSRTPLRDHFERDDGRVLLNIYLTAGLPDRARAGAYMQAAAAGGADVVEVGFPFNDPVADGPILQEANHRALRAGTKVDDGLAAVRLLRQDAPTVGRIVMTYANLVHRPGFDAFVQMISAAGAEALIVPDIPVEESAPLRRALARHDVAFVPLVNPATPPDRMVRVAATAEMFLYVAGALGVTGQENPGPLLEKTLQLARKVAPGVPLVAGFGLRSPADIARAAQAGARGVVIGSAVARLMLEGATPEQVIELVAEYRAACDAVPSPATKSNRLQNPLKASP